MASYTDRPVAFNPYVQQLPVEAMTQVGVQKQALYNQGIQRIQSQVDSVAGLDIVRDVDKSYLQSKMTNLGDNLRFVAAGDFSDFQLVNSVGGMVNQVAKDPNITNAVSSTRNYRKGNQQMEEAIKEGKSSPSNEWDFQTRAGQWLNSEDIRQTFSGGYRPYTDIVKHGIEILKALTKSESITENPFAVDTSGNIIKGEDGLPILSDAIVRRELSGVSPEQVRQALLTGLSPADLQQLEIDGRYKYANYTGEQFASELYSGYKSQYDDLISKRKSYADSVQGTTDIQERNALLNSVSNIDKEISALKNDYEDSAKYLKEGNAEAAKANYNAKSFFTNFANRFSYTTDIQEYKDSPFAKLAMDRQRLLQDWKKTLMANDIALANLRLRQKEFGLKEKEFDLEKDSKAKSNFGQFPSGASEGDIPQISFDAFANDNIDRITALEESDRKVAEEYGGDEQWFERMRKIWEDGGQVSNQLATYLSTTWDERRELESNAYTAEIIKKEANEKFGDVKDVVKTLPAQYNRPIPHVSTEGNQYTYSPEDVVTFNAKVNKYIQAEDSFGGSEGPAYGSGPKLNSEKARNELSPKEYELFKVFEKRFNGAPLTDYEENLSEIRADIFKLTDEKYNQQISDKENYLTTEIGKRIIIPQGSFQDINLTEKEARNQFTSSVIVPVIEMAKQQREGWANSPEFDVSTAEKILTDPNYSATYRSVQSTDFSKPTYEVILKSKEGSTKFQLSPEQNASTFMGRFEPSEDSKRLYKANKQMDANKAKTTSRDGKRTNISNAFYRRPDFKNIRYYGISGDIEMGYDGGYILSLNIKDPVTGFTSEDIPFAPPESSFAPHQIFTVMDEINDEVIFKLINRANPTPEDIKKLEEASQKLLK